MRDDTSVAVVKASANADLDLASKPIFALDSGYPTMDRGAQMASSCTNVGQRDCPLIPFTSRWRLRRSTSLLFSSDVMGDGISAPVDGLEISRRSPTHLLIRSRQVTSQLPSSALLPRSLLFASSSAEFVHVTLSPWCVHPSTDERAGGVSREASDENPGANIM